MRGCTHALSISATLSDVLYLSWYAVTDLKNVQDLCGFARRALDHVLHFFRCHFLGSWIFTYEYHDS